MTNKCNKKRQTGSWIRRRKELSTYYWYLIIYLFIYWQKLEFSRQRQKTGKTKVNTVHKVKSNRVLHREIQRCLEGLPLVFNRILTSACIGENYPMVGRESAKRITKKNACSSHKIENSACSYQTKWKTSQFVGNWLH